MKDKYVIHDATREDMEEYNGEVKDFIPSTKFAVCCRKNGKIVGVGGVLTFGGRRYAFFDIKEEIKQFKLNLMLVFIQMLRRADEKGYKYIYAVPDKTKEGSVSLIERMGFRPCNGPKIYRRKRGQWQ